MHFRTRQMKRLWVSNRFHTWLCAGAAVFRNLWQLYVLVGNHQVGFADIRILKEQYFF